MTLKRTGAVLLLVGALTTVGCSTKDSDTAQLGCIKLAEGIVIGMDVDIRPVAKIQ